MMPVKTQQLYLPCLLAAVFVILMVIMGKDNTFVWKTKKFDTGEGEKCGKPCPVVGLETIEQYRAYLHHTQSNCTNIVQFGGKPPAPADGAKFVCLDKRFNIKPGNCIVFSFGVNNEWSFEDEIAKYGCKVYAYDPTMGKKDHKRSDNVTFFSMGIGNFKGGKSVGMLNVFSTRKVDRFENLVNQLGLAGQVIDYVKLDVELSEVDFLQDMLLNSPHVLRNIKQIAMEVHDDYFKGDLSQTSRQQVFWPYFMLLQCQDFRLVQSRDANSGRWREVVWAREVDW
ncbi:uncharacterized protein [Procambarus clarkii]|uniref:uncharacterized protein n=1 Tax=Procambarus clarkii TaxID=6728 RepID=UPI001E67728B|nr:uncharacterized protein LOC123764968 [Procambarus clarkii]